MTAVAPAHDAPGETKRRGFHWWHLGVVVALLLAGAAAFYFLPVAEWLATAIRWIDGLGWIGPAVFVTVYVVAVVIGAPVTPLNIGAGLVFGVLWGVIVATTGAVAGGVISFLLARHVLRDWVQGKLDCHPQCDLLLERCEKEPWKFLLMLRAHPVLPSVLKNYCLGTTNVRLWVFAVATFTASLPTRLAYAYLGSAGHLSLVGGDADGQGISTIEWWLYGLGFGLTVVLTIGLTWFIRRKIAAVTAGG